MRAFIDGLMLILVGVAVYLAISFIVRQRVVEDECYKWQRHPTECRVRLQPRN